MVVLDSDPEQGLEAAKEFADLRGIFPPRVAPRDSGEDKLLAGTASDSGSVTQCCLFGLILLNQMLVNLPIRCFVPTFPKCPIGSRLQ